MVSTLHSLLTKTIDKLAKKRYISGMKEVCMFGELALVCDADGRDALRDRVTREVHLLSTTVDQPADEAGESPNRSSEQDMAA